MIKKLFFAAALCIAGFGFATAQNENSREAIVDLDDELDSEMLPAPDFTLKNLLGQPVSLTEFQGDWVVIDFWGAWCRWCVKGIPEMKEMYEKYHSKGLEIIGIDCGDTETEWAEALGKYQLPWVNVYNPEGRSSTILQLYGVQGFPTKVIVNPEGYIYETVIGEDPAFYEMIDNIFSAF